jgi:mRNA interferase RelE/StbE
MKVLVQKSFEKDILKITDKKLAVQLSSLLEELETCTKLTQIRHLKKMAGKGSYYRVRLGNYRLGIKVEEDTIWLLRFMHRKEIYSFFP